MSLQPLPQQLITAAKLRQQAKELVLLAEELEASVPRPKVSPASSQMESSIFGNVKMRKFGEPRQKRSGK